MTTQTHEIAEDIIRSVFNPRHDEKSSGEDVLYRLYHLSKQDENLAEKTAKEIQRATQANRFEVRVNWRFEAYMQTPQMKWLGRLPTQISLDNSMSQWAVEFAYETELVNIKSIWAYHADIEALQYILSNPSVLKSAESLTVSLQQPINLKLIEKINQIDNLKTLHISDWKIDFDLLGQLSPIKQLDLSQCQGVDDHIPRLFEQLSHVEELTLPYSLSFNHKNTMDLLTALKTTAIKKVTISEEFEQVSSIFKESESDVALEFV